MKNITILEGVQTIESNVFGNCTSLEYVTIANSVITIYTNAFTNCRNLKIYFAAGDNDIPYGKDTTWGATSATEIIKLKPGETPPQIQ